METDVPMFGEFEVAVSHEPLPSISTDVASAAPLPFDKGFRIRSQVSEAR